MCHQASKFSDEKWYIFLFILLFPNADPKATQIAGLVSFCCFFGLLVYMNLCLFLSVSVHHCMATAFKGQKYESKHLELELKQFWVSIRLLEIKPESDRKETRAFNHWAISEYHLLLKTAWWYICECTKCYVILFCNKRIKSETSTGYVRLIDNWGCSNCLWKETLGICVKKYILGLSPLQG